jgi:regulatory protein
VVDGRRRASLHIEHRRQLPINAIASIRENGCWFLPLKERSKSGSTVAQSWQVQRSSSKCNTPLDRAGLDRLAIAYVGRYATTRAKLAAYLRRKLAERGWEGPGPAPVETIVERCAELGYVDDRAFAEARAASLTRRGYGPRRLAAALLGAGIEPDDMAQARERAEQDADAAALAFARRRRIGPYAASPPDRDGQRRAFAAMLRAGHAPDVVRRILQALPEEQN